MTSKLLKSLARGRFLPLAILLVVILTIAIPLPVQAQGMAISGNFGSQHFQLIPGQSLTTPDIYVRVFNNGKEPLRMKLIPTTPLGVALILPTTDLTLPPGESQQLEIGVKVGLQMPPGEYSLILTAEAYREGEGIKLTGAAQLQAKLTVVAEAGEVDINTVSPQGEDFRATIRLYKQVGGQNLACGYSEMGKLSTKLTPGDYLVEASYQGAKVAEQKFSLAVDERKTITLIPQTIYVEGFAVVRNWRSDTGQFAFAKVAYTINNTYKPLKDFTAVLRVGFEGKLLDEIDLISLPTLDTGKTKGGDYNYIPAQGWQDGTYIFSIELNSDGELCAQSPEVLMVAGQSPKVQNVTGPTETSAPNLNWPLIGGIIGGIGVIALIIVLMRRRIR